MSFVPAPQASAANAASSANAPVNSSSAAAAAEDTDKDLLFKLRTFDVYWVEKSALMYRDGFDKVSLISLVMSKRNFAFSCQRHLICFCRVCLFHRLSIEKPKRKLLPSANVLPFR
jgi:hypothetical protein